MNKNIRNTLSVAFTLALSASFMGCNNDDNNGTPVAPVGSAITAENDLNGQYASACYAVGNAGNALTTFTFANFTDYSQSTTLFAPSDTACSGTSVGQETTNGTYLVNGNDINLTTGSQTVYTIYSLEGSVLFFGEPTSSNPGTSDGTRPTTLASTAFTFVEGSAPTPTPMPAATPTPTPVLTPVGQ